MGRILFVRSQMIINLPLTRYNWCNNAEERPFRTTSTPSNVCINLSNESSIRDTIPFIFFALNDWVSVARMRLQASSRSRKKRFWQLPFSLNYQEAISEVPEILHQNLLRDVRISNNKTWLFKYTKRKHFAMIFNVVTQQKVYSIKSSCIKHIANYGPTLGAWSVDFLAKGTITCFLQPDEQQHNNSSCYEGSGQRFY